MKKFIPALLLLSATAMASNKQMDVIYGSDNRKDVFESTDSSLVELSKSTAAMIGASVLKAQGSDYLISAETLEDKGICSSERFSKQIMAADCSGFLVTPNVLVTAGHCIKDVTDCANNKWVFDYKVDHAEQGDVTVAKSSVYSCSKIISRALDNNNKDDYAVIQLDRKVADRSPLQFRRSGKVTSGEAVAVIGHPSGLPTKIADGAKVRSLNTKFFVANLDTYGGNSGSAVFNVRTGEVEGILVRGENDYVFDSAKGCSVSNKCSDTGCRGEDVTYITNIAALKNLK